jgi:hypothetical protein
LLLILLLILFLSLLILLLIMMMKLVHYWIASANSFSFSFLLTVFDGTMWLSKDSKLGCQRRRRRQWRRPWEVNLFVTMTWG